MKMVRGLNLNGWNSAVLERITEPQRKIAKILAKLFNDERDDAAVCIHGSFQACFGHTEIIQ